MISRGVKPESMGVGAVAVMAATVLTEAVEQQMPSYCFIATTLADRNYHLAEIVALLAIGEGWEAWKGAAEQPEVTLMPGGGEYFVHVGYLLFDDPELTRPVGAAAFYGGDEQQNIAILKVAVGEVGLFVCEERAADADEGVGSVAEEGEETTSQAFVRGLKEGARRRQELGGSS